MSKHRKLASVQYIHDITPIEGADAIECAHVLGWQVVTKKGELSDDNLRYADWTKSNSSRSQK